MKKYSFGNHDVAQRVLLGILGGVCHPVPQILTLFQTTKCRLPHLFSQLASKIHTHFQTWSRSQNATYMFTNV